MTNPISKAIVKAAVAMGYGKKSDYKGSSVADVLEKFAAIAKDKGGSGGGVVYVTFTQNDNTWSCDKTYAELKDAYDSNKVIFAKLYNQETVVPMSFVKVDGTETSYFFFDICVLTGNDDTIHAIRNYNGAIASSEEVNVRERTRIFT